MNYEIKIIDAIEENGKVDLVRLSNIAHSISKVSAGALQIRLKGVSFTKGRKKSSLKDSLKVNLTGLESGSTILCLESEIFEKTLPPYQTDIFRHQAQRDLPKQTPITLFIKTFQDALQNDQNLDLLDKPLLKELENFKKAFINDNEKFIISNQNSVPVLEIVKSDFNKIKTLEDTIPEPEPIVLNGIVEELKFSKLKVKIKTKKGIVDGFLSDNISADKIASFWGKEVTITGINHYKPCNKSVIEIERLFEPDKQDLYFSKIRKKSETVEQQIQHQIAKKGSNNLSDIVGKWPGNEEYNELLNMLTK